MNKEFDNIMSRIKNLREFEVQYTVPETFNFNGPVPFDMSISAGIAYVKVVAVTLEEAINKVEKFFEGNDYED
jgi:hypothetical protein